MRRSRRRPTASCSTPAAASPHACTDCRRCAWPESVGAGSDARRITFLRRRWIAFKLVLCFLLALVVVNGLLVFGPTLAGVAADRCRRCEVRTRQPRHTPRVGTRVLDVLRDSFAPPGRRRHLHPRHVPRSDRPGALIAARGGSGSGARPVRLEPETDQLEGSHERALDRRRHVARALVFDRGDERRHDRGLCRLRSARRPSPANRSSAGSGG
jgi:hypothetical protein